MNTHQALELWYAGRTTRWHVNVHLANTNDRLDGHQHRVATLALWLKPDLSRAGLLYALFHDAGEMHTGDMSYLVKVKNPEIYKQLESIEDERRKELGVYVDPDPEEKTIIKICDWLDAWLWACAHQPLLMKQQDWKDQLVAINAKAWSECGDEIHSKVTSLLEHVTNRLDKGMPL